MHDSLLERGNARLCVFKVGVECEVAFSQQLLLLPCTKAKQYLIWKYLATGNREDGVSLRLLFPMGVLATCPK